MYHYPVPPPGYVHYDYNRSAVASSPRESAYPYYTYQAPSSEYQSTRPSRRSHKRQSSGSSVGSAGTYIPYQLPTYSQISAKNRYTVDGYTTTPSYSYKNWDVTTQQDQHYESPKQESVGEEDKAAKLSKTFNSNTSTQPGRLLRTKQGLAGFINGSKIAAMADTGSRKNVISEHYAKRLGLAIEGSPSTFEIGSSRKIHSIGTVSFLWAFAEKPKETFSILCHVLPRCTYDLILGNVFLTATKTLTEFCHRLTKCLFSVVNNVSQFSFLGETHQRLQGTLAGKLSVLAIPDTGADRNVMSLPFAIENGFELKTRQEHRGYLQFADGSYDKTVGQVETYWTFASGEKIPVIFEVLEYCCSDVIIGEDILTKHAVFQKHAASIVSSAAFEDDYFELAPFDFVNCWQKGCEKLMEKATLARAKSDAPTRNRVSNDNAHIEEQHRRDIWNYEHEFGAKASTSEKELELARRERYETRRIWPSSQPLTGHNHASGGADPDIRRPPRRRMPVIPSIPTSRS